MPNPYLERIKGFGAPRKWGKAEKKPVTNEDDGTQAGYHVEKWNDSQDAVVTPKPLKFKPFKNLGEVMERVYDEGDK